MLDLSLGLGDNETFSPIAEYPDCHWHHHSKSHRVRRCHIPCGANTVCFVAFCQR